MSTTKAAKLEDQAASAALHVTKGKSDKSDKPSNYPLDADGKLSSASAATSLKHASPQDLPAYPTVGLQNTDSSAGAAASLANANQQPFEHWKPGDILEANKAAYKAKDFKADPLWKPEGSAAGSKAALLAAKERSGVEIWRPSDTDAGHSAAGQAMRTKGLSPQLDKGYTADGGRRAMMAATGAMSGNRKRSDSTPTPSSSYPDSKNSAANALKAATSAGRTDKRHPAPVAPTVPRINAGKIHNAAVTNLSREMYTSHPPVAPEMEEKKKQDTLRAAAVSMAKKMYDVQQRQSEEAAALRLSDSHYAASSAHDRPQSSASSSDAGLPQYTNLQEAAKKLATERLAKLYDEHAAYRDYYGTQKLNNRRLSIRGRRRASSDGQANGSDEERSLQIRSEMSLFTDKLAQIDAKKRKQDRDSLLAAAQRNVRASMNAQDERVFSETGKVSPAMMAEWEAKAKAKAEAESEARMTNHGMVNIGGGKFLDQSEVDAIAAAKVQPTLDEITETAEKHRARDEELRQQQLERERITAEKAADDKERAARTKEEWKKFREEEKRDARIRKEEAKAKKAEEKRMKAEENQKSKEKKAMEKTSEVGNASVGVSGDEPNEGNQEALAKLIGPASSSAGQYEKKPSSFKAEPSSIDESDLAPATTADSTIAPMVTAQTGQDPTGALGNAEEIARRVFSAPVEKEIESSAPIAKEKPANEAQQLAIATSNLDDAPVIGAEGAFPAATGAAPSQAPTTSTTVVSPATAKPTAPVASRIAVTPSTETTVSGPSTANSPKEKDYKVSSWLKTKFSRRTSKTTPPTTDLSASTKPAISEPKDPKVFIGGANLGAPDETTAKTSSEQGGSSMREVALAGKEAGPVDAPVVSPADPDEPTVSGALGHHQGDADDDDNESTSISSLSSDEDTRGRSAIRLADQIPRTQPQAPIFGSTNATHDRPAAIAAAAAAGGTTAAAGEKSIAGESSVGSAPHASSVGVERQSSSLGATTDDFEEARDTFDSERLVPPEKGVLGGEARQSDSPARDSRFIESL